jgi:mediator of RNA polymerase II transcription subunit 12
MSSILSPWKLAATAIHLQFMLRQMGREISQESTHDTASDSLDRLTLILFHHSISSEEAYFVAEMARGVESSVASKVFISDLTST